MAKFDDNRSFYCQGNHTKKIIKEIRRNKLESKYHVLDK